MSSTEISPELFHTIGTEAKGSPQSDEAKAWLAELARREILQRNFMGYVRTTHPHYMPGWVHFDIARRVEKFVRDVEQKKRPRLMLLMPPRHGKSELLSVRFPAWLLGLHPTWKLILTSYNQDLPLEFSRQVRAQIQSPEYQSIFQTQLDPRQTSAENWKTTKQGGLYASSLLSGLSGKGCHVLVVDDPVKNMEEADSIAIREKVWEQYTSSAMTRLEPGGGILVVQTWWHDDDLAGRLQRNMADNPKADQFEVVRYPAIATSYEYLDNLTGDIIREKEPLDDDAPDVTHLRDPGEPLHPARFEAQDLLSLKENIPPRTWEALYQQDPVPEGGSYFDTTSIRTNAPSLPEEQARIVTAWDFAIGEKQQNDFTVGTTCEHTAVGAIKVHKQRRLKVGTYAIVKAVVDEAEQWLSVTPYYRVGVEDGHIWRTLAPLVKDEMRKRGVHFMIEELRPLNDKLVRARPLQGKVEQGLLVLPDKAQWTGQLLHEMRRFPAGQHDDCVDSLAWAVQLLTSRPAPQQKKPNMRNRRQKYGGKTVKDRIRDVMLGSRGGSHMSA